MNTLPCSSPVSKHRHSSALGTGPLKPIREKNAYSAVCCIALQSCIMPVSLQDKEEVQEYTMFDAKQHQSRHSRVLV